MEKTDLGRAGIWAGQFDDYPVAVVREAARTIEREWRELAARLALGADAGRPDQ